MKHFEVDKEFIVDFRKPSDEELESLYKLGTSILKRSGCTEFKEVQQYYSPEDDCMHIRMTGYVVK